MKINAKKLEDLGVEIIEEIYNARIEAPVDLNSIKGFDRKTFLSGTHNTDFMQEKIYTEETKIFFSLYENDYPIIESSSLEEIYDYLEERFG